ncbi:uncharacterized protein LOC132047505 [Lycium ferocissimum]|uniref:uncharacterized protein LOC132047505 n=1 Tax=Lycium ferocissimum TaxID=112874 RepID=UPI0028159470|nr:uncharacterized protein LOC132047505 [Lycium ferocissimum]
MSSSPAKFSEAVRNVTTTSTPTAGFTPFTVETSHPFYIHPSDNPSCPLVSPAFDGHDFVMWRRNMLVSLSAKNKLGVITGRNPKPEAESPYYSAWKRCNDMLIAWITNSLTRDIAITLIGYATTKDIWVDLNDRFGQSYGSKYIQIQREISAIGQGSSDIATYFTRMRGLWDELHVAYVGPPCTYGALPKLLEDQQLFQFLSGLNESYSSCKNNILTMYPMPSISKAYSTLQHDEHQKESSSHVPNFSDGSNSFSASVSQGYNRQSFPQWVNFDPKKPTSTPNGSLLHGYPPNYKFTKNKRGSASCVQGSPANSLDLGSSTVTANSGPILAVLQLRIDIILHNVLLVPSCHFNLISIHQLIVQLDCIAILTTFACFLHAPSLKRPLEIGRAAKGLYFHHHPVSTPSIFLYNSVFNNSTSVNVCSSTVSSQATVTNVLPSVSCNPIYDINKANLF